MWALSMKAGGPCLTPRRLGPAAWGPLATGEAGRSAVAAGRRLGRRGPALVAVGASGRGSKNGPGDGRDDEAKDKASSSDDRTGKLQALYATMVVGALGIVVSTLVEETGIMAPAVWEDCNAEEDIATAQALDREHALIPRDDDAATTGDSSDGLNQLHNESKSNEPINISNSNYWRDVRANLVLREQEVLVDPSAPAEPKTSSGEQPVHQLPQKLGSRGTFDGPFGVILNRPLYTKIKDVNPSFQGQATPFGDSPLFFGGPVDMSMFLVRASDGLRLEGFEEVVPGIRFGFRTELEKAAVLMSRGAIRTQDLRFFVGHAAWDYKQLLSEIREGYWAVASYSTELIGDALAADPSCLWTEVLQLMGGHYSELSQKPKQDK
ncbi:hypothetical protein GUJ93_ZPchr0010g11081 [Zizania palustris]|uniref:Uncharacterized protein n=1 Tax=Zizania palustris TaxID=103762 RepID=A0A8J5W933_ZIZPA|nr:hypothetical protein GUJ93_ZPchr0010g11081 [Zizania palustris]